MDGRNSSARLRLQDASGFINEPEAATCAGIFRQKFRWLSSVHRLQQWLRENNIKSRSGNHFFRGALYTILRNRHCIGLIKHRKDSYPAEHQAIIQRETWDKVQALLSHNIQGKRRKPRATKASLFTGILFDAAGTRYTPTHATKNGRRYRYYTSQAAIRKTERADACIAHDLETGSGGSHSELAANPTGLLAALRDETTRKSARGFFVRIWRRLPKPHKAGTSALPQTARNS